MSSIADQIITLMINAVTGLTDAQSRVFRSRETAITHDEAPSIVIKPVNEESKVMSSGVDENTLIVALEIFTRGDPPDQLADPVAVAAHRLLSADPQLACLITSIRRKERNWEGQEADDTAGFVMMRYEVRYLTAANDMTVSI